MQDLSITRHFLKGVLSETASASALDWLEVQEEKIRTSPSQMKLFLAFSQASRHFPKEVVKLSEEKNLEARKIRHGFQLTTWTALQTARTVLILGVVSDKDDDWIPILDRLFESADMHEQEALYSALPLLPFPEKLTARAAEGIRTNITSVFDAVALDNPYPSEYLDEAAWNQLLLKAIFMQRPLYRIVGAEGRANLPLARTLVDYVHERWSAGRNVIPELWRFLVPFVDEEILGLLEKVLGEGTNLERKAAALACSDADHPGCPILLSKYPDLEEMIARGAISWEGIGRAFDAER
ncbi:EboA domain-containing protein [Cyclobacterium xiamenense]|uniref:EboA domain-containing protein n=1 Tax=Cyclobacterium xiamenense TaxID=1297121 RepID=UPI0012B73600|nr:EboA domain-containing protein [Cyclobacterium xiamenense]